MLVQFSAQRPYDGVLLRRMSYTGYLTHQAKKKHPVG